MFETARLFRLCSSFGAAAILFFPNLSEAQCAITIHPVVINAADATGPTQMTVSGTALKCTEVTVSVSCTGMITRQATPDPNTGRWTITLTTAEIRTAGCVCPGRIAISTTCSQGGLAGCSPPATRTQNL